MSAILECVKPGAKKGQIILAIDLTLAGNSQQVLEQLSEMGYDPTIRHISYATGVHVHAVLRDEQQQQPVDDDYLMDDWIALTSQFSSEAVLLWRGL